MNVSRRLGNGGASNTTDDARQSRQAGSVPFLQIAVVVDVIFDPSSLTQAEKDSLSSRVANPRAVNAIPRNSVIARIVSNAHDLGDPRPHIIYPFFQSHFELPLKAGEQIFIVFPDIHVNGIEQSYWVTRVPEPATVEDLNFTHGDRRFDQRLNPPTGQSTSERSENNSGNTPPPNFPNGGSTPETFSLAVSGANDRPYEAISEASLGNKQVTFEAIPRFIKRPGEFALVGSNNTRIVLGEDRTGSATRVSGSASTGGNAPRDKTGKAGTIDIVAGVGSPRFMPANKEDDPLSSNPAKRPTSPHVVENTRHYKEVDKASFRRQKQDNPKEGDPDFKRDLSRIYVSMKTAGDKNFGVRLTGTGGIFTDLTTKAFGDIKSALDPALPDENNDGQPFVINKSEQIRLIATKKDEENGGPAENGSIRLIKEGTVDDKDLSLFVMDKNGNIFGLGKNIQLLTHDEGKIFLRCKDGESGNADPIVLFSKFKELEEEVYNKMRALRDGIADKLQQYIQQTCAAPNAAGPFSPVPAITLMNGMITSTANQIKQIDIDFKSKIDPCKSKWVFVNKENQS